MKKTFSLLGLFGGITIVGVILGLVVLFFGRTHAQYRDSSYWVCEAWTLHWQRVTMISAEEGEWESSPYVRYVRHGEVIKCNSHYLTRHYFPPHEEGEIYYIWHTPLYVPNEWVVWPEGLYEAVRKSK